jgi:hypothetical protein
MRVEFDFSEQFVSATTKIGCELPDIPKFRDELTRVITEVDAFINMLKNPDPQAIAASRGQKEEL